MKPSPQVLYARRLAALLNRHRDGFWFGDKRYYEAYASKGSITISAPRWPLLTVPPESFRAFKNTDEVSIVAKHLDPKPPRVKRKPKPAVPVVREDTFGRIFYGPPD